MICRQSRDQLALALRQYVSGRISNDDLDSISVDWRDRGAVAIKEMAWALYDDNKNHYATGRYAIGRGDRHTIAQWIVFLHSDKEYVWPSYSFIQVNSWLINMLTLGWWGQRVTARRKEFEEAGDYAAWPFVTMADLEELRRQPKYFVGRSRG